MVSFLCFFLSGPSCIFATWSGFLVPMEQESGPQASLITVQGGHTEPMTQTGGSTGVCHSMQQIFQLFHGLWGGVDPVTKLLSTPELQIPV